MSKLNLNDCSVSTMTIQDKMNTIGGDPFLSDLGDFFGNVAGSIAHYLDTHVAPGYVHSQYGI